jgi:hypothetical protein
VEHECDLQEEDCRHVDGPALALAATVEQCDAAVARQPTAIS